MAQVAGAGSALLAHLSNSNRRANRDEQPLEDARAGRARDLSRRLASGHPQCADHHLPGALQATLFPPGDVLRNQSFFPLCRRGSVSAITACATIPESTVRTQITQIAQDTPNRSASTPASKAPSAY